MSRAPTFAHNTLFFYCWNLTLVNYISLRSFWMLHNVSALFFSWATSSSFSFWLMTLVNPEALRTQGRLRKTSFSMPYVPCHKQNSALLTETRNSRFACQESFWQKVLKPAESRLILQPAGSSVNVFEGTKSYYLKPNSNTEIDDFRNSTSKSLNFVYIQQAADKSQRYRIMVCCSDNCKILFPDYRGSCKFSLLTFLPPCGIMQLVQTKCRQLYIGYTGHALPYHLC